MTVRAVLLGLAGAAFVAATGYFNDQIMLLTPLVGNHMPIIVFGLLAFAVMVANPLLFQLHRRVPLRRGELATIVAIMLVACSIPGAGLMWTFIPSLGLPAEHNLHEPSWQRYDVLSYVPDTMLPRPARAVRVGPDPRDAADVRRDRADRGRERPVLDSARLAAAGGVHRALRG
jgi:hypothetical protein